MAVLFMEGFDNVTSITSASRRGFSMTNGGFDPGKGRFGGGCMIPYTNAVYPGTVALPFSSISGDDIYIGFGFRRASGCNSSLWCLARGTTTNIRGSGANTCFYISFAANSQSATVYNAAGTSLGTFSAPIDNLWHWVNINCHALSGTSGTLVIKIDKVTVFSATGVNMAGASATGTTWTWNMGSTGSGVVNDTIDDLIICDSSGTKNNSEIPDCRIISLIPNSLESAGNWTANTGTIPAAIDDVGAADDDTTYISTSTAGDEFAVGFSDLPVTPTSIGAVQVVSVSKKTGTDSSSLTPKLVTSATGSGVATVLTTSYGVVKTIFENDPGTGTNFTVSDINSIVFKGSVT